MRPLPSRLARPARLSRLRTARPRLLAVSAIAAALLSTTGCWDAHRGGAALGPDDIAPVRLALRAVAQVQPPTGVSVALRAAYTRRDGTQLTLGEQTAALEAGRETAVPFTFDLAPCLRDAERAVTASAASCAVALTVRLLRGPTLLDEQQRTLTLTPGRDQTLPEPVALYEVTRVQIAMAPAGTGGAGGSTGGTSTPTAPVRLEVGERVALTAALLDRAGAPIPGRTVRFETLDSARVRVDASTGQLTALTVGPAQVRAVAGERADTLRLEITPESVAQLTLGPADTSVTAGATVRYRVEARGASGALLTGVALRYASSAPSVATLDITGAAATRSAGEARLTVATDAGRGGTTVTSPAAVLRVAAAPEARLTVATSGDGNGAVTSSPGGISCARAVGATSGTCETTYPAGTPVTLTAAPASGSTFAGWSGAGCSGTAPCTVTMGAAQSVTASFVASPQSPSGTFALAVAVAGSGAGTVASTPAAISCTRGQDGAASGTCTADFPRDEQVTLRATPATGSSTFAGWSGAGCSGTETCVVRMTRGQDVTATFTQVTHTLTVTTGGVGAGTVSSAPAGVSCTRVNAVQSGACAGEFAGGARVTLTATPAGGSTFTGWSGGAACSGNGACTLTMDGAQTVSAIFGTAPPSTVALAVTIAGAGNGTVRSSPPNIECTLTAGATSGTCGASYTIGQAVTLTATPATGSTFAGWSGAGCSGTGTCAVSLSEARAVTATFAPTTHALTVTTAGAGSGTVTTAPAGINCTRASGAQSGTCTAPYASGASVTLTAAPASPTATARHTFAGWNGGGCSGTQLSCTVTMSAAQNVTASFGLTNIEPPSLTVTTVGTGTGTVTGAGGMSCTRAAGGVQSGTCTASYNGGTSVTLTARPTGGSTFAGFTGAGCSGTGPTCTVTMDSARSVIARFDAPVELTVTTSGAGAGRVTSAPQGISCARTAGTTSGTCTASYSAGTSVTLTAQPDTGTSVFTGWGGVCAHAGTSPTCVVSLTSAQSATASFGSRTAVWTGTLNSTATTRFGGGGFCTWDARFTNVSVSVSATLNSTGSGWSVTRVEVRGSYAEQIVGSCPAGVIPVNQHVYVGSQRDASGTSGSITANVSLSQQSGRPAARGTLRLPGVPSSPATLTLQRTDYEGTPQHTLLDWTITGTVPLTRVQ